MKMGKDNHFVQKEMKKGISDRLFETVRNLLSSQEVLGIEIVTSTNKGKQATIDRCIESLAEQLIAELYAMFLKIIYMDQDVYFGPDLKEYLQSRHKRDEKTTESIRQSIHCLALAAEHIILPALEHIEEIDPRVFNLGSEYLQLFIDLPNGCGKIISYNISPLHIAECPDPDFTIYDWVCHKIRWNVELGHTQPEPKPWEIQISVDDDGLNTLTAKVVYEKPDEKNEPGDNTQLEAESDDNSTS